MMLVIAYNPLAVQFQMIKRICMISRHRVTSSIPYPSTFQSLLISPLAPTLIVNQYFTMSSSSMECQHRCAQMFSMAMFLQDISTRTNLLDPQRPAKQPQPYQKVSPSTPSQPSDPSIQQMSQLPDRTI
ncbi:MIP18 family protein [Fusarium oxysporum f. sp. albedinis]|nr:MIP18 family protein [Fusarium oxysporum f. sp. albedinis]